MQERGELTGADEMVDVITKMRVVSARHYGQMSQWGFHTLTMGAAEPSPIVFHRTALLREPPVAQHSPGKIGHFGPESGLSAAWPCNPRTNTAGPRPRREEHREPDTSPDPADVIPQDWRYATAVPGPDEHPRRKESR